MTAEDESAAETTDGQDSGKPPLSRATKWTLTGAIAGVVALIAAVVWAMQSHSPESSVPSATPQQAVQGFLDALASADADRALEYALTRPADTSLLTSQMLEASHDSGSLVVVNVPEIAGAGSVEVPAQVTMGGQPTTIVFSATRTDAGWRLAQITSTIDPGTVPASLGITLSGQPLADLSHIEVFPGLYDFADSAPEITFSSGRVVVDSVGMDIRAGLQPVLTERGEKKANAIAATSLRKCLAAKDVAPDGCPNSVRVATGQKVNTKTIKWTLIGNPWKDATYTLDVSDPTQARGAATLNLRFRCTLTQNGDTYMVDQRQRTKVRYLLTVTDAKAPVVWQRIA